MKIHVSHCYTEDTDTHRALKKRWESITGTEPFEVKFWEAGYHETHPQLLWRIWQDILTSPGKHFGKHVITEMDFIPFPEGMYNIRRALNRFRCIFAPWSNRNEDGSINDFWPMVGPWFMAFSLEGKPCLPPSDWFDTIDRPFDVACPALVKLIDCGFFYPKRKIQHQCHFLKMHDEREFSGMYGIRYTVEEDYPVGIHCFYSRTYAALKSSQLGNIEGETVGGHRRKIEKVLERL